METDGWITHQSVMWKEKLQGEPYWEHQETHKDTTNALINRNASATVQTLLDCWESEQMT